jgi:hypothetical protein
VQNVEDDLQVTAMEQSSQAGPGGRTFLNMTLSRATWILLSAQFWILYISSKTCPA